MTDGSDVYELQTAQCLTFSVNAPAVHGRCSTDWIAADVPKGGAEEIAALRAALVAQGAELDEASEFRRKVVELLELAGAKF